MKRFLLVIFMLVVCCNTAYSERIHISKTMTSNPKGSDAFNAVNTMMIELYGLTTALSSNKMSTLTWDSNLDGFIDTNKLPSSLTTDSELSTILSNYALSSSLSGKFNIPLGNTSQVVLGDGSLGSLPSGSTITPDTTTPTKAAAAVLADSASSVSAAGVSEDSTHRFVTDTEKSTWNGKQNALGFTAVPDSRTINGRALTSNVSVTASDVGLGNVDNTSDANKPVSSAMTTALGLKVNTTDLPSATVNHASTADRVLPTKTNGIPGFMKMYEANSTDVDGSGFIGPLNSTAGNIIYRLPSTTPTVNHIFKVDSVQTGQTLPDGSTGTIANLVTSAESGGTGGYVSTPTYSDGPCDPGQWSFDASYCYICRATNQWDRYPITFANWNNPTPTTYTLTLTVAGEGTVTIGGNPYTSSVSPHSITGLSGATAMTTAYGGSNDLLTWTGSDSADITGTYPNFSIDMDAAKSITGTFSVTTGGLVVNDTFTGDENPLSTNWTTVTAPGYGAMSKTGGSAVGVGGEWNAAYWDTDVPANDQYARITLTGAPGYHGVILRDNVNGLYTAYASSHGTRVYVQRLDKSGSVYTSLIDGAAYSTTTVPSGATLELRISGSTLTCLVNGTPINGSILTDTTYTSGNIGVLTYGTAIGIDAFEGGDL